MAKAHKLKFKRNSITATVPVTLDSTLAVTGNAAVTGTLGVTGVTTLATTLNQSGANGSNLALKTKTATISGLTGASGAATDFIPAGAVVLAVLARVTTLITSGDGATSWKLGDESDDDKWGATLAFTAGTTVDATDWVAGTPTVYDADTDIEVAATSNTFSAGAVEIVMFYLDVTAPTS